MQSNRFLLLAFLLLYSFLLHAQEATGVNVYTEQTDQAIFVYGDNDQLYPQSVRLELSLKGIKPKEEVPKYQLLAPTAKKQLLAELVIPQGRAWGYSYSYVYFMGDANAKHDDDFVYRLPYESGQSFKIGQGYNGKFSHHGENALDFDMDEGTTVLAARGGTVVGIKEDSNRGCTTKGCANRGNYVRILHDDGTFADYYHLQQNGALVEPGEQVEMGQEIGKSGNTGWSSGPHLHFIVYKREEKRRVSYPTLFKTAQSGTGIILKEEETHEAVN